MSDDQDINALPTVLLLDDDLSFLSVVCRAMSRRGYLVWPATTIEQAMISNQAGFPDFAVLDLHLGDGSGLEVLDHLRKQSAPTKTVILSGYANLPSAVSAAKLGADDCLAKPVDADELDKALMSASTGRKHIPDEFMHPDEARLQYILSRWIKNDLNTTKAADELGIHRRSLQRMLRRAGFGNKSNPYPKNSKLLTKFPGLSRYVQQAMDQGRF